MDKEKMEAKLRKKKIRGEIGSYGWALLIYYLIMNVCVIAAMVMQMAVDMIGHAIQGNYILEPELDAEAMMATAGDI
jgi:hypothetical protein